MQFESLDSIPFLLPHFRNVSMINFEIKGGVVQFDFDAKVHGFKSHGGKIFLHHSGERIARLYAVGDHVRESNVGTVFAQFGHLKLTSLYKNPSMLNMQL